MCDEERDRREEEGRHEKGFDRIGTALTRTIEFSGCYVRTVIAVLSRPGRISESLRDDGTNHEFVPPYTFLALGCFAAAVVLPYLPNPVLLFHPGVLASFQDSLRSLSLASLVIGPVTTLLGALVCSWFWTRLGKQRGVHSRRAQQVCYCAGAQLTFAVVVIILPLACWAWTFKYRWARSPGWEVSSFEGGLFVGYWFTTCLYLFFASGAPLIFTEMMREGSADGRAGWWRRLDAGWHGVWIGSTVVILCLAGASLPVVRGVVMEVDRLSVGDDMPGVEAEVVDGLVMREEGRITITVLWRNGTARSVYLKQDARGERVRIRGARGDAAPASPLSGVLELRKWQGGIAPVMKVDPGEAVWFVLTSEEQEVVEWLRGPLFAEENRREGFVQFTFRVFPTRAGASGISCLASGSISFGE